TEVEEVLVMHRFDVRGDEMSMPLLAVFQRVAGHGLGRHDTSKDDLGLQAAVLMKDPVQSVLIVARGGDEANHKLPAPARFVGLVIEVLPEQTSVSFVNADGARKLARDSFVGGDEGIDKGGVLGAIRQGLQRTGKPAET